jgi:hypothetical protein
VIGRVTNVFRGTLYILVNGFIIVFIGIYGAAAPRPYVDGVVYLIPRLHRSTAF